MRQAEGIEVGTVDSAAWDEAISRFGPVQSKPPPKKENRLASLSLHARRLLPPDTKGSNAQD